MQKIAIPLFSLYLMDYENSNSRGIILRILKNIGCFSAKFVSLGAVPSRTEDDPYFGSRSLVDGYFAPGDL
jgi:hypothetical protein